MVFSTPFTGGITLTDIAGAVRRCIEDYSMIQPGETVAVGVSGGKDSLSLLCALAELSRYMPQKFRVHAITMSMGFEDMDFSPVAGLCRELDVPYTIKDTHVRQILFDERREKNPCAMCAKMRRGVLHRTMNELGIKKIALGHHYDDAVETFMLSLLYEGRINCFQPVTYLSRSDVYQLRPMLYVSEKDIIAYSNRRGLPVVHNSCPMDGVSKRQDIKELIASLGEAYPDVKSKVFGAIQRYPLEGWKKTETKQKTAKKSDDA